MLVGACCCLLFIACCSLLVVCYRFRLQALRVAIGGSGLRFAVCYWCCNEVLMSLFVGLLTVFWLCDVCCLLVFIVVVILACCCCCCC